jgi:pyruvate/2-oxoglutarate dehydrogenase complex dihydrolipoamide dehydrogenase (E3) component
VSAKAPLTPDLCIVGAGSGGLSVAAGAVQMGARVVLIERGKMGGDCLNYGCVPSKALIAAARAAQAQRASAMFGVAAREPEIDFAAVMAHVHGIIAEIAPHDSVERFEGLGVKVIAASARFVDRQTVEAGGDVIRARRFVIATGSRPRIPNIPGLAATPHLTNETLFDLRERPAHLLIIGGGPIGVEMAQAFARLGARVTVIEAGEGLQREDRELAGTVVEALQRDGVELRHGAQVRRVWGVAGDLRLDIEAAGRTEILAGSHLLVAAGRLPTIEDLGLAAGGIETGPAGIKVDARLTTTNRRVFAIGDVAGGPQFTHLAGYHASIVIRNALFRVPAKARADNIPRVTLTDPELAQVGLIEAEACARRLKVRALSWPFADNDRACTERRTDGLIKVIVSPGGRILGAGIAGPGAGELILPWVLAIDSGLKIGALASLIAPYPTLSEISKRAAGSFYTPALFGHRTRRLVRLLAAFG